MELRHQTTRREEFKLIPLFIYGGFSERRIHLSELGAQNRPGLFIHAVVEADECFRLGLAALGWAHAQDGSEGGPHAPQIVKPDGSFVERNIIRDDAAAFSGDHQFGGLETVDSDVSNGACPFALIGCTNSLRRIFQHHQAMLARYGHYFVHIRHGAGKVRRYDDFGLGSDLPFQVFGIHREGLVDFAGYGQCPSHDDHVVIGVPGFGRKDDLRHPVPRPER